jgi:hypothetical protein
VRLLPRACSSGATTEQGFWHGSRDAIMRQPAVARRRRAAAPARAARARAAARPGSNDGIPQDLEAVAGSTCSRRGRRRRDAPTTIVVDTGRRAARATPRVRRGSARGGCGPTRGRDGPVRRTPQHVDPTGRYLNVEVVGRTTTASPRARLRRRLRDEIVPAAGSRPTRRLRRRRAAGRRTSSTSRTARSRGSSGRARRDVRAALRAFRSLLLPLKAILLNLLSIGAAYGCSSSSSSGARRAGPG